MKKCKDKVYLVLFFPPNGDPMRVLGVYRSRILAAGHRWNLERKLIKGKDLKTREELEKEVGSLHVIEQSIRG